MANSKAAKSLAEIFKSKNDGSKYVNHEFQIYGHYLATQLDSSDKQTGLFIKLAKTENRALLERCLEFVKGVNKPKSKVKLFLWKFKQEKEKTPLPAKNK
jgi:hypothetical protein